jgi:hypothetical protein
MIDLFDLNVQNICGITSSHCASVFSRNLGRPLSQSEVSHIVPVLEECQRQRDAHTARCAELDAQVRRAHTLTG